MNRQRLKTLQGMLENLQPCGPLRSRASVSGYTGAMRRTGTRLLCEHAAGLPAIDTLDTSVDHGLLDDGTGCTRVLGSIAGVTILLHPHEAAEAARKKPEPGGTGQANRVARDILGLRRKVAEELFGRPADARTPGEPITPQAAAGAVGRILAGAHTGELWSNVPATRGREPGRQSEDDARNFLDRRDEIRISHRLGRPFTF